MLPKPSFTPSSSGINNEDSKKKILRNNDNVPTTTLTMKSPYELQLRPEGRESDVTINDANDVMNYENQGFTRRYNFEDITPSQQNERRKTYGGSRRARRHRPSRKYKKSKRVFRKKSRSTRRR